MAGDHHHPLRRLLGGALSILLVLVAVVLVVAVLLVVFVGGEGEKKHKVVVTKVDTADKGKKPDKTLTVPAQAVQEAAEDPTDKPNAKNETPPGVPPPVIEAGREQQDKLAIKDILPIGIPLAAPSVHGCLSRFLARNYSSRRGVAPRLWVIHWSGGRNLSGWQDVAGLTAFGNNPQAGVSWHFNIDREGHCHYNVNVLSKAWTEAGFNPFSISVEIINTGGPNDHPLLSPQGLRVLGRVISDTAKPFHIPLRLGAVSGCKVVHAGIVSHRMLGPCGGGHPDIGNYSLAPIINAAKAARARTAPRRITATDRRTCRKINWWRTHGRHHGKPERNAVRRVHALAKRGVKCRASGPRKQ
jgi:hypothetical protein